METETHTLNLTNIQAYFSNTAVFITGGTGFLGRLLVEKLLSTCNPSKIYILVRSKKGKSPQQRFLEYFDCPIYDSLKRKKPQDLKKLQMVEGDVAFPNLGMKDENIAKILSEVHTIFHLAATVRFNEKLNISAKINVAGTIEVLELAKKVKCLKSIIHVSTAYSFCPLPEIDEVFYKPIMTGENLLGLVNTLDEDMLGKITPTIIGKWPNTYSFTISIAEEVVRKEGAGLPLAIVRPSIVLPTVKEPIGGWADNFNGPTSFSVSIGFGFLRVGKCAGDYVTDWVPADYVVNCCLAAAWDTANVRSTSNAETLRENNDNAVPIYNYVSSPQRPITWRQSIEIGLKRIKHYPSIHHVWEPTVFLTTNEYLFIILHFLLHLVPAYTVDFFLKMIGKEPQMVEIYAKIMKGMARLTYFTTHQWVFHNTNTQKLWRKLDWKDKELFEFNMETFYWHNYFDTFAKGVRLYLLKEPLDTLPQARKKQMVLKVAHYILIVFITLAIASLFVWKVIL